MSNEMTRAFNKTFGIQASPRKPNDTLGRPNSAGYYYISDGELQAAIKAALRAHSSHVHTLERKLRAVTNQRDKAKGRTRELQGYVTKYQRELAQLKKEKRHARPEPD